MDNRELVTRLRLIASTLTGVTIVSTKNNLDRMLGSIQELESISAKLEKEAADGNGG